MVSQGQNLCRPDQTFGTAVTGLAGFTRNLLVGFRLIAASAGICDCQRMHRAQRSSVGLSTLTRFLKFNLMVSAELQTYITLIHTAFQ